MSSCSSASSASSQQIIQQLLKKATSPTPPQSGNTLPTNKKDSADTLNTSGSRGTTVNIKS